MLDGGLGCTKGLPYCITLHIIYRSYRISVGFRNSVTRGLAKVEHRTASADIISSPLFEVSEVY